MKDVVASKYGDMASILARGTLPRFYQVMSLATGQQTHSTRYRVAEHHLEIAYKGRSTKIVMEDNFLEDLFAKGHAQTRASLDGKVRKVDLHIDARFLWATVEGKDYHGDLRGTHEFMTEYSRGNEKLRI